MPRPTLRTDGRPCVMGHRGVPKRFQENTLAGFRCAAEMGLDGIELDVFLTKDERVVVFHDDNVKRLTGVDARIAELTWDEVCRLRVQRDFEAGRPKPYDSEQPISLLEEVLDELKDTLTINVELKAYDLGWATRHTGTHVAEVIRRVGAEQRVIVTSFSPIMLRYLEKAYPGLHSGFAYDRTMLGSAAQVLMWLPEFGGELSAPEGNQNDLSLINAVAESNAVGTALGATVIGMQHSLIDGDTIERMHRRGLSVGAYTFFPVDTRWAGETGAMSDEQEVALIGELAQQGIDWFETDDPERMMELLSA